MRNGKSFLFIYLILFIMVSRNREMVDLNQLDSLMATTMSTSTLSTIIVVENGQERGWMRF